MIESPVAEDVSDAQSDRPIGDVVAITCLMVLALLAAFDSNYTIVGFGDGALRPHHGLAAVAFAGALFGARTRSSGRIHWGDSSVGQQVLVALGLATAAFLLSSYFAPLVTLTDQRTLDVVLPFLVTITVVLVATDRETTRVLVIGLGAGAALATVVALLAFALSSDVGLGDRYRGEVTLLGDERRLTRPFSHANIAAMYFAPGAVAVAAAAALWRTRGRILLAIGASVICVVVALTASRGGIVAVVLGLGIVVAIARTRWSVVVAGGCVIGLMIAAMLSPAVQDRVGGSDRFAATVGAPDDFDLGETRTVSVFVRNDSSKAWAATGDERVSLAARWRSEDQVTQWITHVWPLPHDLGAGEQADVAVQVPVQVPDGRYVVLWDLLLDEEAFFLESRGIQATSVVDVSGSDSALPGGPVALPRLRPGRTTIWRWAVELIGERPWFGHGAGKMRFVVAEVADSGRTASASHAHNLMLEPLSAWGLVGGVPFVMLIVALGADVVGRLRRVEAHAVAIGVGLLVMMMQGAVDWPLMFPPPAVLLALLAGLWVSARRDVVVR